MKESIRKYLSKIGSKGGRRSRRILSSEAAKKMVCTREAKRAFKRFHVQCFWSYDPNYVIKSEDTKWVAEQLMKNGNREAWEMGVKLSL